MNALYMRFAQQEQADEGFNRGIANIAAAFSPPSQRSSIAASGAGQTADPGALFNNIMQLQQYRQQQIMLQNTQAAIPGLVKAGIISPEMVPIVQNNPALLPNIIQAHQPEGAYRNWGLARDDYVRNNSNPNDPQSVARAKNDFEQKNPLINVLTPAGGDPELNQLNLEKNNWQAQHLGEPLPDDGRFNSPEDLKSYKNRVNALSNTQNAASSTLPTLDYSLGRTRNAANELLNPKNPQDLDRVLALSKAPGLLNVARQSGWAVNKLPSSWTGGPVTQDQLDLLHDWDDLTNTDTGPLKQANPHLASGFVPIDADLGSLRNPNIGSDAFKTKLGSLVNGVDTVDAEAIGASGQLDRVFNIHDDATRQSVMDKMDESYMAGGRSYLGDPKKLTQDKITEAKQAIAAGAPRDKVIRQLRMQGFLPKPGEI